MTDNNRNETKNSGIYNVVFQEENKRAAVFDGDKEIGYCELEDSEGNWTITHTVVDPTYGGKGLARKLVEKVIAEARKNEKKIVPQCSYAEKMMRGKEEFQDVLCTNRQVIDQTKGTKAIDGAGVHLVRVLGNNTAEAYDPFLMLDSFDSENRDEYIAGFPTHPHRGIETVSFLSRGQMTHRDHLGTEAVVYSGEAQWLTAGSGAFHSEMPDGERLLGAQLWLNLPAKDKMTAAPAYHGISNDEIKEFPLNGGVLRLVTGTYRGEEGWQGKYLPLDFYDIHLEADANVEVPVKEGWSAFVFTLAGDVTVSGTLVREKTAAKLGEGSSVVLKTGEKGAEVLIYSSRKLGEPIAWYGPIVMNTEEELQQAFDEINAGSFIKKAADYDEKQ